MEAMEALLTRTSVGGLTGPAPGRDVLDRAFAAALRAPDHRMLRPWRFLTVSGAARERLGEVFLAAGLADNPGLAETERNRLLAMPLRAPLLVVAILSPREDDKVPFQEQVLSAGASVQNLLLALHASGYAAMWRTGWMAGHAGVRAALGLAETEHIVGFVYTGTASSPLKTPAMLPPERFVADWTGPA